MESATKRRPYIFVSYASVDRDRVLQIVETIRYAGVEVWVDLEGIGGGENYGFEIVEAIKGCWQFVLMCTPAALASRNVRQEIQIAWNHNRPYLPLLIEPTTFPNEVQYWLEGSQWIEVLGHPESQWLRKVLQALARSPSQPPTIPVRPQQLPTPTQLEPAVIARAEAALAHYLGPVAMLIVKRAVAKAHDESELHQLLSEQIDEAGMRAAFLRQLQ